MTNDIREKWKQEELEEKRSQLDQRINGIISGLSGMNIRSYQLKTDEKNLYNRLLIISGIHKDIKVNQKEKLDQINKLKNDLGVAEGEIQAGNDNPLILSELQQIIYKLKI